MVYLHEFRINNLKPIDEDVLIGRIETSLTNSDIERYFPGLQTLKYSELNSLTNIDELLPNDKDFKIILIEQDNNVGHWVCIMKNGNTIEYFNPYGTRVDNDKKWIGKVKNMLLNQHDDVLSELMEQSKYKCVYSKTRFQKLNPKINTCGRWCILRLICLKDMDMNIKQFKKFIKNQCDQLNLPKDALVAYYIG